MMRLRRRPSAWLVTAALIGALASVFAIRAASGGDGVGETVVVADRAIPAGTVLAPDASEVPLRSVTIPAGLPLAGLVSSPDALDGLRTIAPLAAGEPVTLAALGGGPDSGPGPLLSGERAVSVPLAAAGSAASALRPGVRVDAVASVGEGAAGRSEVVVADAEVLAVDSDAADSQLLAGSVIVRVSEKDALALTEALNFAREVRLLVRPLGEVADG